MTIETLNERIQLLLAQKQDATDRINQAMSDLNAINGAIQEVNFWTDYINKLKEE